MASGVPTPREHRLTYDQIIDGIAVAVKKKNDEYVRIIQHNDNSRASMIVGKNIKVTVTLRNKDEGPICCGRCKSLKLFRFTGPRIEVSKLLGLRLEDCVYTPICGKCYTEITKGIRDLRREQIKGIPGDPSPSEVIQAPFPSSLFRPARELSVFAVVPGMK